MNVATQCCGGRTDGRTDGEHSQPREKKVGDVKTVQSGCFTPEDNKLLNYHYYDHYSNEIMKKKSHFLLYFGTSDSVILHQY